MCLYVCVCARARVSKPLTPEQPRRRHSHWTSKFMLLLSAVPKLLVTRQKKSPESVPVKLLMVRAGVDSVPPL